MDRIIAACAAALIVAATAALLFAFGVALLQVIAH